MTTVKEISTPKNLPTKTGIPTPKLKQGEMKIVVVGDVSSGKKNLSTKFVHDKFNDSIDPTLGAFYSTKTYQYSNSKSMKYDVPSVLIQLWNISGQSKYRPIAVIYYRGERYFDIECNAALCVYDVTSMTSFETMKGWVLELQESAPKNIIIAVVGSKIDKTDSVEVSEDVGRAYAKSVNAIFQLTSAKEGKGVNVIA